MINPNNILFEDNHLIIINKEVSEIVQGDRSGDMSLDKKIKEYIKIRDNKPGNVYLGLPHRLDRPVSGVVVYTKTSKALSRMNRLFKERELQKVYHAIVKNRPPADSGQLRHYLKKNEKQNKSWPVHKDVDGAREAILDYRILGSSNTYYLLEIILHTGRHHQIRAQLATMDCPIKGDLKYGFPRSNKNKGISLHAYSLSFVHPVRNEEIRVKAPYPEDDLYRHFT